MPHEKGGEIMEKTCENCVGGFDSTERCKAKGCMPHGLVDFSAWTPKRPCLTCQLNPVTCRDIVGDCGGPNKYLHWQPKQERTCPPCAECVHDFERKFEPFKVTVEVTAETHGKWLLHKMDGIGTISESARAQLKAHGIT